MRHAVVTEAGPGHENQDRVGADPGRGVFIVADGMGGLADAGATAQAVVDRLPGLVSGHVGRWPGGVVGPVTAAAAELNEQVRGDSRYGPGNAGAATALLIVRGGRALAVHLGDSRIYLARAGVLRRITDDHAVSGRLTRFVGMDGDVTPGVSVHELEPGDRWLLCTDGLAEGLDEDAVHGALQACPDAAVAGRALVDAARAAGATDDISVIVVDHGGAP